MTFGSPKARRLTPPLPAKPRYSFAARTVGLPSWVLLVQVFIGLGWLRAVVEKLIDPTWWNGTGVNSFLAEQSGAMLGWYEPIARNWIAPYAASIAIAVVALQLFAASTLLSGRLVVFGLFAGMFLNVNFMAAGSINPSVFYLLAQGALAFWLAENSLPGKTIPRVLSTVAIVGYVIGMMSLPYIHTIHPADVMRDPAVMLVFSAVLTIIACDQAYRRIVGGRGLPVLNWLFRREESRLSQLAKQELSST
jgi:thiosulfate dehydrogenase (quinone) large subunit